MSTQSVLNHQNLIQSNLVEIKKREHSNIDVE